LQRLGERCNELVVAQSLLAVGIVFIVQKPTAKINTGSVNSFFYVLSDKTPMGALTGN
jgi:hypothetical protein